MFLPHAFWITNFADITETDVFYQFRKKFSLPPDAKNIILQISADTNFTIFFNGVRLNATQFYDVPPQKTVSEIDLSQWRKPGENILAIRLYYMGKQSSIYCPGQAGLAAAIFADTICLEHTSCQWLVRKDPAYTSNANVFVTNQMAMVFEYDARKEEDWTAPDYDDSSWHNAVEVPNSNYQWEKRPVPFLKELPMPVVKLRQSGFLRRFSSEGSFAVQCFGDYASPKRLYECFTAESQPELAWRKGIRLAPDNEKPLIFTATPKDANGCYAIFDLGEELTGYLSFDVIAPEGCIIDIMHGEHLDDGRVRGECEGRNFTDRYHCKANRNRFTHFLRRAGGRYVELHFTQYGETPIQILYCGMLPVEFPLQKAGDFETDDKLLMKLLETSERTLRLCMHEHYEDCPWREQALYAYDSRNQMLYGYLLFGNYEFARASLELLGRSYCGQGEIGLTSPTRNPEQLVIPIFSMCYLIALAEHYLFTGDLSVFEKHQAVVGEILQRALARFDAKYSLYYTSDAPNVWNFCEWSENLYNQKEFPQSHYNLYFKEALEAASTLYAAVGNHSYASMLQTKAQQLGTAIESVFYSPEKQAYGTLLPEKNLFHEHVQSLLLRQNLIPAEKLAGVLQGLKNHQFIPATFSGLIYTVDGLMNAGETARSQVEELLFSLFAKGIFAGDTTLPETPDRGDDFTSAGSLCHAWSAIPVYYAQKYLLGIFPLSPGFARFRFRPCPGVHRHVHGKVPTPSGVIECTYQKMDNGKIHAVLNCPANLQIIPESFPEFPIEKLTVNGKAFPLAVANQFPNR